MNQPTTEGRRYNTGKPRLSLVPHYILNAIYKYQAEAGQRVVGNSLCDIAMTCFSNFLDEGDEKDLYRAAMAIGEMHDPERGLRGCMEDLAMVYTRGADKYTDRDENGNITYDGTFNWGLGMSWLSVADSGMRHIRKFELGELNDEESGQPHLMHALWNVCTLLIYVQEHPEWDDRRVCFVPQNVGYDLDGVLAAFTKHFLFWIREKLGRGVPLAYEPQFWNDQLFRDYFHEVEDNVEFWETMPAIVTPDMLAIEPVGYITTRPVSTEVSENWLAKLGFPKAPVINTLRMPDGKVIDKATACRMLGIKLFYDDSYANYENLRKAGIACLLVDRPHNRRYDVGLHRVTWSKVKGGGLIQMTDV